MADRLDPELAILFVIDRSEAAIPITKLMTLLFLADVEHQQLYGEPLTDIPWVYHHYGAFSEAVYDAASSLHSQGLIEVMVQREYHQMGKKFRTAEGTRRQIQDRLSSLSARACRVLNQVLQRYGNLEVWQLKQESYQTATMKHAAKNERLDLSHEPRRGGAVRVPGVAQFLAKAPAPIIRDIGDPESSAQEDLQILDELGTLRRTANRE